MTKITVTLFLFVFCQFSVRLRLHNSNPILKYNPPKTEVAVLPIVDLTPIKDDADKSNQLAIAKQFTDHGFKIVDNGKITKAISNLKIDLNDKKQLTDDNLCKIGKAVGAKYCCV